MKLYHKSFLQKIIYGKSEKKTSLFLTVCIFYFRNLASPKANLMNLGVAIMVLYIALVYLQLVQVIVFAFIKKNISTTR